MVYDYTPSHSKDGPTQFLKVYRGYLQSDGYAGYNESALNGDIIQVGCFFHARRNFFELKDEETIALEYLKIFDEIFAEDRAYQGTPPDWRKKIRHEKLKPKLDSLKLKLEVDVEKYLPKSPVRKAMGYCLNQWEKLYRVLEDGRLELSNNFSERCIRLEVIGRKNSSSFHDLKLVFDFGWLFAGSEEGAKRSAMMFSFVQSCKLLDVDPWGYFRDILSKVHE